jgi:hypothetical protein
VQPSPKVVFAEAPVAVTCSGATDYNYDSKWCAEGDISDNDFLERATDNQDEDGDDNDDDDENDGTDPQQDETQEGLHGNPEHRKKQREVKLTQVFPGAHASFTAPHVQLTLPGIVDVVNRALNRLREVS